MRIDLHTHSSASDGTERPADLVRAGGRRRAGRRGADRPRHHPRLGAGGRGAAVPACRWCAARRSRAVSTAISLHLLAYLFDPVARGAGRRDGAWRWTTGCRGPRRSSPSWPTPATPSPGSSCSTSSQDGATVGRPHIADTLVAAGVVRRPQRGLHRRCCTTTGRSSSATTTSTRCGRSSWSAPPVGVPVFAHPAAATRGDHRRRRRDPRDGGGRAGRARGRPPRQPAGATGSGCAGWPPSWACWSPVPATTTARARTTGSARTPPTPRSSRRWSPGHRSRRRHGMRLVSRVRLPMNTATSSSSSRSSSRCS